MLLDKIKKYGINIIRRVRKGKNTMKKCFYATDFYITGLESTLFDVARIYLEDSAFNNQFLNSFQINSISSHSEEIWL